MKTASVADLRNRFADVARWIELGEEVTITKRGKPFARLVAPESNGAVPDIDRRERLRRLNPAGRRDQDVMEILLEEREDG